MKKNKQKLTLTRETLRNLQDSELRQVVGGRAGPAAVPIFTRVDCSGIGGGAPHIDPDPSDGCSGLG
jgi:hypothetical protein